MQYQDFRPDFLLVPYKIIEAGIDPSAQRIYGTIYALQQWSAGVCYASNETISKIAKTSVRSVERGIEELISLGFVVAEYKDKERRNRLSLLATVTYGGRKKTTDTHDGHDRHRGRTRPTPMAGDIEYKKEEEVNTGEDKSSQSKSPKFSQAGAEVIKAFEGFNPAAKRYYANTTQRKAADDLVKIHGLEMVLKVVRDIVPKTNGLPHVPTISTPLQLLEKWVALEAAIRRKQSERSTLVREFTPNI
jgi:hypothetical protein